MLSLSLLLLLLLLLEPPSRLLSLLSAAPNPATKSPMVTSGGCVQKLAAARSESSRDELARPARWSSRIATATAESSMAEVWSTPRPPVQ